MTSLPKTARDEALELAGRLRARVDRLERLGCLCDCLAGAACSIHDDAQAARDLLDELAEVLAPTAREEENDRGPADRGERNL